MTSSNANPKKGRKIIHYRLPLQRGAWMAGSDEGQLLVHFQQPTPPVRVPVKRPDGRTVLDFPSEDARSAFQQRCSVTVAANCLNGARSTCSLAAIDKCRGPAWLRWLGWKPRKSWAEIEACEKEAMHACVVSAESACRRHAQSFCEVVSCPPEQQQ